jgi:AcrR family transcriptional regulator
VADDTGSPRLTRKERERQRVRRDILDAALAVFARSGYHRATIEDIARQAGYATGSIYNYFKNKQHLFTSLVQQVFEQMRERLDGVFDAGDDFETTFEAMLDVAASFSADTANANRFLFDPQSHAGFASEDLHTFMEDQFWHIMGQFTGLVQKGIDEGALRPQEPSVAAHALLGLTSHFAQGFIPRREGQMQLTPEIFKASVREYFLRGAGASSPDGGGT